jgi:hypothetical protein
VLAEPYPYRAATLMVDHLADLWRRYAPIREVMRGAASSGEPALRDLWELSEQQRLTAARAFVTALAAKGPLRENLDVDLATDVAWVHINLDIYLSLVNRRGWSETAYRHWLADTLTAALLLPAGRRLAEPPHTGAEQAPEIARPLSSTKRAALSLWTPDDL